MAANREPGLAADESVPVPPVVMPDEQTAEAFPVRDGLRRTIGWQWPPGSDDGPTFVLLGRSGLGLRVLARFPFTETGWADAWVSLAREDPRAAGVVRAVLRGREDDQRALDVQLGRSAEIAELDARSLARALRVHLLGGYAPEAPIAVGEQYDARFLQDRFAIFASNDQHALAEVLYADVEDVEIGGPGMVQTGGAFIGGGFGLSGALEGMAIASVLNALTTRKSITTIIRIQARGSEFFLLDKSTTPQALRMELSHPLGAIRAARSSASGATQAQDSPARPGSPASELAKLADLLNQGLLTREEFEELKAKILRS
jgi:hypothetical protein